MNEEPFPIHLVYRLSDMAASEKETLEQRWHEMSDERRRVLTRHMADISEENFAVDFSPVFAFCLQDRHAPVRVAALDGVWDTTNTALIDPIIGLMKQDESVEVRTAAAQALAHYVLMAEWGELPKRVAPPIVEALLHVYDHPETAVSVRRAVVESLGASGHPRVDAIIREAYESSDDGMQLSAVFAMGKSADGRWLPILLEEMNSFRMEMRAEAARAAGNIGSSDATAELAQLTMDEEPVVQVTAVTALGQIGSDEAQRILESLLDDPEFEDLHDVIEETMEEMMWLGGELDLLLLSDDDDDEEDLGLEGDWLEP